MDPETEHIIYLKQNSQGTGDIVKYPGQYDIQVGPSAVGVVNDDGKLVTIIPLANIEIIHCNVGN